MRNEVNNSLMAIGAHADDLELNIGGTLAKYHECGYEIVYVMSTDNISGSWSRRMPDGSIESTLPPHHVIRPQRLREAEAAARALGTEPVHLNHPQRHYTREDGQRVELRYGCERPEAIPEDVPTILTACEDEASIERVKKLILKHRPEAILTHGMPMANPEHFATAVLVLRAYRQAVDEGYCGMMLTWPDIGIYLYGRAYSGWDTFVDVSLHWERKLELSALHACQKPDLSLMDWPPFGAACGCRHAEVFTIIDEGRFAQQHGGFTLEILNHQR